MGDTTPSPPTQTACQKQGWTSLASEYKSLHHRDVVLTEENVFGFPYFSLWAPTHTMGSMAWLMAVVAKNGL